MPLPAFRCFEMLKIRRALRSRCYPVQRSNCSIGRHSRGALKLLQSAGRRSNAIRSVSGSAQSPAIDLLLSIYSNRIIARLYRLAADFSIETTLWPNEFDLTK